MKKENFEDLLAIRSQIEQIVFKGFLKEYDLPKGIKQVHAIAVLELRRYGFMSMSELSYLLNLEKASITTIADKLVNYGYITSERSKEDRRVYHLKLTDEGIKFAKDYGSHHMVYIDDLFNEFNEKEYRELFDAVNLVTKSFERLSIVKELTKK